MNERAQDILAIVLLFIFLIVILPFALAAAIVDLVSTIFFGKAVITNRMD